MLLAVFTLSDIILACRNEFKYEFKRAGSICKLFNSSISVVKSVDGFQNDCAYS